MRKREKQRGEHDRKRKVRAPTGERAGKQATSMERVNGQNVFPPELQQTNAQPMLSLHGHSDGSAATLKTHFVKHNWLGGQVGEPESLNRAPQRQRGSVSPQSLLSTGPRLFLSTVHTANAGP